MSAGLILLLCSAGCLVLLFGLLGWYELAARHRAASYRRMVSAARLAIRQEDLARARRLPRPRGDTSAGSIVFDLSLDATAFQEQIRKVQAEAERVDTRIRDMADRLAADISRRLDN